MLHRYEIRTITFVSPQLLQIWEHNGDLWVRIKINNFIHVKIKIRTLSGLGCHIHNGTYLTLTVTLTITLTLTVTVSGCNVQLSYHRRQLQTGHQNSSGKTTCEESYPK